MFENKEERKMKAYYPALFVEEDGKFNVTFPDVPEAITCGDSLEHAVEMAKECLGLCLDIKRGNDEEFPKRSNPSSISCEKGQFILMIEFDSIEFNKRYNSKSVRKNVTIPAWLADIAEERNINFSNILQNALIEKLGL